MAAALEMDRRMTRRGFLSSILALCAAPAIVRADSLMRIVPRETLIVPSGMAMMMADQIRVRQALTMEMITREVLRIAHEKIAFVDSLNRQFDAGWSTADSGVIRIRRPVAYA